ncbi:hypothetical protein L7F22_022264 [Adiantum nelumboides]|nr:hypothetical protein [Adiantum nelumboides]
MSDVIRAQQLALRGLLMPVADEPNLIDQEYADDTLLFLHYSPDVLDTIRLHWRYSVSPVVHASTGTSLMVGLDATSAQQFSPVMLVVLSASIFGCRALVANQVLLASAWYVASCWTLHGGVMRQLRRLIRIFLLGASDGTHDTRARVRWSTVIIPTSYGGLGIIDPEMHSRALLTKLIVKGLFPGNEPWKMLLQSSLATVTPTYGVRDGHIWTTGMRFLFTDAPYADKQFVLRIDVPQQLLSVACRIWNAVQVNKKQTVYALILRFSADVNTTYEQAMSEAQEGIEKPESEPSTALALQSQSRDDLEYDLLTKRFGSPSVSTETLDSIMDGLKMDGWALLHLACYMDDVGMVELLLQYGAQVNVRDSLGRTPLHNCLLYRRNTVAKLLLARGAGPAAVDEDGKTPLQVAMELGAVTDEELFVLLS